MPRRSEKSKPKEGDTDKKTQDAIAKAKRRRAIRESERKVIERHDLYETDDFTQLGARDITIYREDKFTAVTCIDDVTDFTLASFLMENKVGL